MSSPGRRDEPTPGAMRSFDFPAVHGERLDNGLQLRYVGVSRLPVVTTGLVLDAGEGIVDHGRAGLAVLTGDSLEGGTAVRSGVDLAEALETIGAGLSIGTGWDSTTISVSCMADRLDEAMELLAEVVLQPTFPADEVERVRGQSLAAIQQRKMDPASIATDVSRTETYADSAPYGRPLGGTHDSVASLSSDSAAGFVEARYRPGGAGLVVVGDVDVDHVKSLAERSFGNWSGEAPRIDGIGVEPRGRERRMVVVHRPAAVQSEIRIGHVGQPRSTSDYFPLLVLNVILGGAFTSRLNLNLREANGFTYGVRSQFSFRRSAGPWTISTAVGTEVTAAAVREALSEVEKLLAEGPTDAEVEAARDYIAGIFPLRLETTSQIASRIAELLIYDLPDDYHSVYRERVRSVTKDQASEAARRCIRPDEMTVVVVGDGEQVRAPLEELDWAPLEVESAS